MKIYVWEGNNISDAYHNDGTLVVAANSIDEARTLVRDGRSQYKVIEHLFHEERTQALGRWTIARKDEWTQWDINHPYPIDPTLGWDGTDEALDREPEEIDISTSCVVAFNGGGYD